MKSSRRCPKRGSTDIVRVPDNAHRILANSICGCGHVEDWVESQRDLAEIRKAFPRKP